MARSERALRRLSSADKQRLARSVSRRRRPWRALFIILLVLLVIFILLPYFF
ncbi:hypothetical protein JXA12_01775 [Candidatus Woesearchaeota archaeon]|nr:hypothetical protein [Candidatus Woesearchaeota archaeon]